MRHNLGHGLRVMRVDWGIQIPTGSYYSDEGDWHIAMARITSMPSTVLVIDDDTAAIQMLKETLESYSFKVITAQIVQEGIEVARECKPDVIVIDLFMTGLSGEQICRAIREFTRVPILVLSAMTKPGAVAQALNEGADDYLIKPVSAGVLVAHLNNLIRRAHGENGAQAVSVNPL